MTQSGLHPFGHDRGEDGLRELSKYIRYSVWLGVLIAALDLPVAADLKEVSFSWSEIAGGKAVLSIKNLDASNTWSAIIEPVIAEGQTPPTLLLEPSKKETKGSNQATQNAAGAGSNDVILHIRFEKQATPVTEARYLITITRGSPPKTSTETTLLRVRPAFRLVPQPSGKYVLTASRCFPFTAWIIETPLALQEKADVALIKSAEHKTLGVVYTQSSGLELSAVVQGAAVRTNQPSNEIPLEMNLSPWSSGKMSGTLTLPDGQTREVIVQTSDSVLYPLVVISVGVVAAFLVKRYLTRGRPLDVLRATLADTEIRLRAASDRFRRDAGNRPFAAFTILTAWRDFRAGAEADIANLKIQGTALDQNNQAFRDLSTRVNDKRQLPAAWITLGSNLRALDAAGEVVAAITRPSGLARHPAIGDVIAACLHRFEISSLDQLPALSMHVTDVSATVQLWHTLWDFGVRIAQECANNPAALALALQGQRRLWDATDIDAINAAKLLLNQAAQTAAQPALQIPVLAKREAVVANQPPAQPVALPEIQRIQLRDQAVFFLTMTLAVIAGLNAEYFGKPFGSIADYARVLAWALSTSIAVDIATLALDRMGSALGSSPRVVTRA
jgi:hypothetical protein